MSVGGSETDDQSVELNEEETLESAEELEVDSEDSDLMFLIPDIPDILSSIGIVINFSMSSAVEFS